MINNYDVAVLSEKVAYLENALKAAGVLPDVTASDNGSTLQVVNGAWATGDPIPEVINALDSTSETAALSAAQGKVLNTEVATKITVKTATGTITTSAAGATNFENIISDNAKILRVDVLGIQSDRICFLGTWNGNILGYVFTRDFAPVVSTEVSIRIVYYE